MGGRQIFTHHVAEITQNQAYFYTKEGEKEQLPMEQRLIDFVAGLQKELGVEVPLLTCLKRKTAYFGRIHPTAGGNGGTGC